MTPIVDPSLRVGDMAQVVAAHCVDKGWIGRTFVVARFIHARILCAACRADHGYIRVPVDVFGGPWAYAKRVSPPEQQVDTEQNEELYV